MSLCSMCYQNRETKPLYVGGPPPTKIATDVCRGCAMQVEKALNFISFRGYIVDLVRQPHLWSDAMDEQLTRIADPEATSGGNGLVGGESTQEVQPTEPIEAPLPPQGDLAPKSGPKKA